MKNILDSNISYAYTDKVLDPCPWGQRVYFYDCTREGGHGTWMNNNLSEADGAPEYHTVTANWTFNRQWDPEKTVRELWKLKFVRMIGGDHVLRKSASISARLGCL